MGNRMKNITLYYCLRGQPDLLGTEVVSGSMYENVIANCVLVPVQ